MTGMELQGFAVGVRELADVAEDLRGGRGIRDGRICICGHPVTRHSDFQGTTTCTPTRMLCPCRVMLPVIDVVDTRPFLRKTQGEGTRHALMQGLYGLIEKGREWKWMMGFPICMRCEKEGVDVLPFAISESRKASRDPEKVNVLLCTTCAAIVGRDGL